MRLGRGGCLFLYIEREWGCSQQEFGQSLALGQKAGKEAGSKTWHIRMSCQGTSQPAFSNSGMCHSPCQCPREESLDPDITFLHIACWAFLSKTLLFRVSPKALQDLERKCLL